MIDVPQKWLSVVLPIATGVLTMNTVINARKTPEFDDDSIAFAAVGIGIVLGMLITVVEK
jgi:hypothetical protein